MNRIAPARRKDDMDRLDPTISRRTALTAVGTAGVAATLAACGSATAPRNPSGGTEASRGNAGHTLAKLASIPVGEAVSAQLAGEPVVVARPSATTAECFSAICTHMGCTVSPVGKQLHCPCHNSVYDATTGKVISGPAPRRLPRIPVQVRHGEVVTA